MNTTPRQTLVDCGCTTVEISYCPLHAAAPALLAALKACYQALALLKCTCGPTDTCTPCAARQQARAAIKAAEGKE